MNILKKIVSTFIIGVALAIFSCSTASVTTIWKYEQYKKGPFNKIVVVALFKSSSNRMIIENAVRDRLIDAGAQAVSSLNMLMHNQGYNYAEMKADFKNNGIDGILVIKLKGVVQKFSYDADESLLPKNFFSGPDDTGIQLVAHFRGGNEASIGASDYDSIKHIITLECTLFSLDNGKPVWKSEITFIEDTETADGLTDPQEEGADLSKLIAASLKKNLLIRKSR